MTEIFGVTGWKNSGKTTLVVRLVEEFARRGFRVSTVKHAHDGFDIDHEGTDSYRHRLAGAGETAIISSARWALIHEVRSSGAAPTLDTILAKLAPCELVLVEGFKNTTIPKIECIRQETVDGPSVWQQNASVVALATDHEIADCPLPQIDLDDTETIADHIAQKTGLGL